MVSKLKAVAEDKRNGGGGDKKKKSIICRAHVIITGHELGSTVLWSERSTTELPEHVFTHAQFYKYKFICEVAKRNQKMPLLISNPPPPIT